MSIDRRPEFDINVDTIQHVDYLPLSEQKEKVKGQPVAIIIPPSPFLADERVFPHLGPLKVASELAKPDSSGTPQNPVAVLDLSGVGNYQEVVREFVQNTDVRTFGLTATSPQIPYATEIARTIKQEISDSRILLGGPHVTLTYTAYENDQKRMRQGRGTSAFQMLQEHFDVLIAGDGEIAIFYAIDPGNQQRVINASNRHSPLFMQRGTLDEYQIPARDLIDLESYQYYITDNDGSRVRATSVIGQLGCPFECGFCGGRHTDFLRMTRTRSIGSIVEEIEQIVDASENWEEPIRGIMFYDDELNVNPGALETLCEQLINLQEKKGFEMRFRGFVKAELFNEKQANLMHAAGFRVLLTGVESGSDKILTAMKKHTSKEINSRLVRIAHNTGLRVKALMSIGHPGESQETIQESISWALQNLGPGDEIDWTIITQYPGSPYFDDSIFIPEKDSWLFTTQEGENLWSSNVDFIAHPQFYKGIPGKYTAFVWTDHLTPEDLVIARDYTEKITRKHLDLPSITKIEDASLLQFEHSMGQSLPPHILRASI